MQTSVIATVDKVCERYMSVTSEGYIPGLNIAKDVF